MSALSRWVPERWQRRWLDLSGRERAGLSLALGLLAIWGCAVFMLAGAMARFSGNENDLLFRCGFRFRMAEGHGGQGDSCDAGEGADGRKWEFE